MPVQQQKGVSLMIGHIDPSKETFAAFRAKDRRNNNRYDFGILGVIV